MRKAAWRRELTSILFAVAVGLWAMALVSRGVHRDVFNQVCDLITSKFYQANADFTIWSDSCLEQAKEVSIWQGRSEVLKHIQWKLDELQVSHLNIFDPVEDRRLWKGESVDTGLRTRWIDGHVLVTKVMPGSPAALGGVRLGDEVVLIGEEPPRSMWQVQSSQGFFKIRRAEGEFRIFLEPTALVVDRSPQLVRISAREAVLEISSFRSEYFAAETWRALARQLSEFQHVIVDLRDNSGGNLVAMLRGLSPFLCTGEVIGELAQPRKNLPAGPPAADDLDDWSQLATLDKYARVPLKTYTNYGCFNGPVTVLVDQGTASVAEMFAQAMRHREKSRVWGAPTAGDVLLATWYNLPLLGEGYSVSIPEAQFLTPGGDSLEGGGIWPDQELKYDFEESQRGIDSWIARAHQ